MSIIFNVDNINLDVAEHYYIIRGHGCSIYLIPKGEQHANSNM